MPTETMPEAPIIDEATIREDSERRANFAHQTSQIDWESALNRASSPEEAQRIYERMPPSPIQELLSPARARRDDLAAGEVSTDMGKLTKATINGVEAWRYTSTSPAAEQQRRSPYYDTFQLDPDVPYEEAFMATNYGPQLVKIPKYTDDKKEIFTTPLEMMEATRESNGGAAIQENVQLAQQLLQILLSRRYLREHQEREDTVPIHDSDGKEVGRMPVGTHLLEGFIARQHFHSAWLAFDNADDSINTIIGTHKALHSVHLNELFRIPEFIHALQYYEDHGLEFTGKKRDDFRKEALGQMQKTLQERDPKKLKDRKGNPLDPKELMWAVNLAERYWEYSADRALQDTAEVDEFNPGKIDFQDDLSGANYWIRRMDFGNWARTNEAGFKTEAFSRLVKGFQEYGDLTGDPNYKGELRLFDVVDYFRAMGNTDAMKDLNPNFLRRGVTAKQGRYDFINTDWERFDFRALGDNPMANWSFRNFFRNENAREPFAAKPEAYFRNPSLKTLKQLNAIWDFRGADQWRIKELLALNYLEFARNERHEETGKLKYDHDRIRGDINDLAGILDEDGIRFIDPKKREEIKEKILGKEPFLRRMLEENGFRFVMFFLLGFLKEAATEFWAYGMNEKKN